MAAMNMMRSDKNFRPRTLERSMNMLTQKDANEDQRTPESITPFSWRTKMTKKITNLAVVLCALGMFAAMASPARAVLCTGCLVFSETFDSDQGGDGLLLGDTTTIGGLTWGAVSPHASVLVGTAFGQGGTNGGGSNGDDPSRFNALTFPALTPGTWRLSYDLNS